MQKSLIQMKKIILLLCNAYRKYTKLKLHIETEKLKKKVFAFFRSKQCFATRGQNKTDREFKTLMTKNDNNDKIDKKIGKSSSQPKTTTYRHLGPRSDMLAVKKCKL